MDRTDYIEIKDKFNSFVKTWNVRDIQALDNIIQADVFFSTSTSLTMANGAQDSIFGVYDFLKYYPYTDILYRKIYNYVCRMEEGTAYAYAEVPCTAFNINDEITFLEYVVLISCQWKKDKVWKIADLRIEIVLERGNLQEYFKDFWHFEKNNVPITHEGENSTMFMTSSENNDTGGRLPVVRGEGDSPWLNVPSIDDYLTEEEKIKETIIKYYYGDEHNSYVHCYQALSDNYQAYACRGSYDFCKKELINELKAVRQSKKYVVSPIKFTKIEIDGKRAYVCAEQVRGLTQNSREYDYSNENIHIEHTCSKNEYEMILENGEWKIAYINGFKGLYESDMFDLENLFGDEC